MCNLKSLNVRLELAATGRRPSAILPSFHSLALVPSNRTRAPSGGLAFDVELVRTIFFKLNEAPSSHLPDRAPSASTPEHSLCPFGGNLAVAENSLGDPAMYFLFPAAGSKTALVPSSLPSIRYLSAPFHPSPGKPPGRSTAWKCPLPRAMTWQPNLAPDEKVPVYSP